VTTAHQLEGKRYIKLQMRRSIESEDSTDRLISAYQSSDEIINIRRGGSTQRISQYHHHRVKAF